MTVFKNKIDPFTKSRVIRFIKNFRKCTGELPTLNDFQNEKIGEDVIKLLLKEEVILEFYVTLNTGTIVKGYKVRD